MSAGRGHRAGAQARRRRRKTARGLAGLAAAALLALGLSPRTSGSVEPYPALPAAQPVIGAPTDMTLIGSSPAEAAGETWGYSTAGGFSIERYSDQAKTWHAYAPPLDGEGRPLEGFTPAAGPLAGSATPGGGVAIVGEDSASVGQVLVRNPGGSFQEAPTLIPEPAGGAPPAPNALLRPGETLSAPSGEGALMSAIEQPDGRTGLFLVPFESAAGSEQGGVLLYDGTAWTREPICVGAETGSACPKPQAGFRALAIGASSPQNAWLLAQSGSATEGIALFSRETAGGEPRWVQRSLGAPGSLGAQFAQARQSIENPSTHEHVAVHVAALTNGQPLTVTSEGVWVDGQLGIEAPGQPATTSDFTLYFEVAKRGVSTDWCNVPAALVDALESLCPRAHDSPELELPGDAYRSFAWTGDGPFGERVITGLAEGVSLSLHGEDFKRVLGVGGESGTRAGAAFASPEAGWLADADANVLTHLTPAPGGEPDLVQSWPVPFRRPLAAIAEQPGATDGELEAQALAVGDAGQVARYIPEQGWTPEALLNSEGKAQEPDLRGVAWPTPNRAYAVGTDGAMWLWRAETGLWEPDPARPPNLFLANFTGIAFDPSDPLRGYAIGQQGVLLRYGKTWEQERLPPGLEGPEGANFTSIAFAGGEALATYQLPHFQNGARSYTGGVLVNDGDGSGWQLDTAAQAALGKFAIPMRAAGLPDGGAALASAQGEVIERQGPGSPWQPAPAGTLSGYSPVALAPFREGGVLRAVLSVEPSGGVLSRDIADDEALKEPPSEAQAPVATAPYPLPASGFVVRETAAGWRDEEHAAYPAPDHGSQPGGGLGVDWPVLPDAVLAFALDPGGEAGWAVGGQTGEINENVESQAIGAIQTAGVMRYPSAGTAPPRFSISPEQARAGSATFAIGGGAQCASACADLSEDDLGPDAWLANAIARAGETAGVRDFLYTGPHVAPGLGQAQSADVFTREEEHYSELLSSFGGTMGVFAAPSESDLDGNGNLEVFDSAMTGSHVPRGAEEAPPERPPGTGAYAFESSQSTGGAPVRVVVLDYSRPFLGEAQQCWLARQLAQARQHRAPAIVIGSRGMNAASDASQVTPILVKGAPPATGECRKLFEDERLPYEAGAGASAYFFDSPEQNRDFQLTAPGAPPVPAFGSGTLGYVENLAQTNYDFVGASGFLLAEVDTAGPREADNRARVTARLIPDISDLALDATNGVLLRRSRPALFTALARRPHAGGECVKEASACNFSPDPYVQIPSVCQGTDCATGLFPQYTFTSSNPDKGQFVEADPASPGGTTVLQGANGKPIPDEPRISEGQAKGEPTQDGRFEKNAQGEPVNEQNEVVPREESGLFCAYNPGTTMVTVHAGGISYSEQVTVQAGSVEQPCGTVPLRHPPAPTQQEALPVPPPAPAPAPTAAPQGTLPPPPPPPVVAPVLVPHVQHRPVPATPPRPVPPAQLYPIVALVPPPAPAAARPTPPSGTAQVPAQSPVSQPVGVAQRDEERQGATEMVHHMAAYEHRSAEAPLPAWPLGLVLLAAAAGVGLRRPRPQLAHANAPRSSRDDLERQSFTNVSF